tara:strand:+ start:4228 stop:4794 length:567 start_codon:yes stop_codon:yes gene_type:complete
LKQKNRIKIDHLLQIREVYQVLRFERKEIFGGLPYNPSWIRFRYLRKGTVRTLGLTEFETTTIALHSDIFDYSNPLVLKGLLHHELLHLVLGFGVGHNRLFKRIEEDWEEYSEYFRERGKFVRAIEDNARKNGKMFRYECPNCRRVLLRTRRMKKESACSICCNKLNSGVWIDSYVLVNIDNGGESLD